MATVPATHTFGGTVATSSEMNSYARDPLNFLLNKPETQVRQTATQTLTSAVFASITFDIEDLDKNPDGSKNHSTSVNTSRFTAVYAGWYRISGSICFAPNATGIRESRWAVNGTPLNASAAMIQSVTSGGTNTILVATTQLAFLNVNDYVELQGLQSSGGNLTTAASSYEASSMSVVWERNA